MQRLVELKDFDSFILEKKENNVNRDSLIEKAVSKLKKEFGATAKDFIASTKQRGIDEIQDLVARTLKPYLNQTDSNDLQMYANIRNETKNRRRVEKSPRKCHPGHTYGQKRKRLLWGNVHTKSS